MPTKRAVGIDLGTTNSVSAWVNDTCHTELILDRVGNRLLPSAVLFEDEKILVGEEAKLKGRGKADRLVTRVKRFMGKKAYEPPVRGQTMPPEVIQACILNTLRTNLVPRVGGNFGVVIAVPSFFTEPQRKATMDAGVMAGLNVIDLVNEPVAAVLAASEYTGLLSPGASPEASNLVLVYDLGGFTFEVTLLEVQAGGLKTLASSYDENLGGLNFDQRIAEYAAAEFKKKHKVDLCSNAQKAEQLVVMAARARHTLSMRRWAPLVLTSGENTLELRITRELFAKLTKGLLEKTAELTRKLVESADVSWKDLSRVILVGGATRMPSVRRMLTILTGQELDHTVHSDEAVARGAAIYANHLIAMEHAAGRPPQLRVTNVSSHSLGIEGINPRTGKKFNRVILPRGTPLPAKVVEKFVTKASAQQTITLTLLEGEEADLEQCTVLGKAVIRDLPPELAQEWPVDVTCEVTKGGRIHMDAQVRYTDRKVQLDLVRPVGLSQENVKRWKAIITSGAGFSAFDILPRGEQKPPVALATPVTNEQAPPSDDSETDLLPTRYLIAVPAILVLMVIYLVLCWFVPSANIFRVVNPPESHVEETDSGASVESPPVVTPEGESSSPSSKTAPSSPN